MRLLAILCLISYLCHFILDSVQEKAVMVEGAFPLSYNHEVY